jgi:hypothetical protein
LPSRNATAPLHLVCDGGGLPLTAVVTAANAGDTITFQAVLDDVPPVRTPARDRGPGRWFAVVLLACAIVCFNRRSQREWHDVDSDQPSLPSEPRCVATYPACTALPHVHGEQCS